MSGDEDGFLVQFDIDPQGYQRDDGQPVASGFRVLPEHVPTVISHFQAAIDELNDIWLTSLDLGSVGPPGLDPHSTRAAEEISRQANQEPGRHGEMNRRYRESLQAVIDNLQASLEAYNQAEGDNAVMFPDR